MAMIQCEECGQWISDRANACPHCGCPMYDSYDVGYQQEQGAMQARYEAQQEAQEQTRQAKKGWVLTCLVMCAVSYIVMYIVGKNIFSTDHFYSLVMFVLSIVIIIWFASVSFWKLLIAHLIIPHMLTIQLTTICACAGYVFGCLSVK